MSIGLTNKCLFLKLGEPHSGRILEVLAEMRQIIESKCVSHHFHIYVVVHEHTFGFLNRALSDMITCRMARHLLYHVSKVTWGDKKLIGIVSYLLPRPEMVVELRVEAVEKPRAANAYALLQDGSRISMHI